MLKKSLLALLLASFLLVSAACGDDDGGGDDGEDGGDVAASECSNEEVETPEGLIYKDIECGEGEEPETGDTISVHYTGTLEDGTEFDSSIPRGQPFQFVLGAGQVIQGWDIGFQGMKVGGKRELKIPPELGYGPDGSPPTIPPNSTLIFEVELVDIAGATPASS